MHHVLPRALGLSAKQSVGTTEVIVIAVVAGGIVVAAIAASLIKSLGRRAIDKVEPADVPYVLWILGFWIRNFASFLPAPKRRKGEEGCAIPAAGPTASVGSVDTEGERKATADA